MNPRLCIPDNESVNRHNPQAVQPTNHKTTAPEHPDTSPDATAASGVEPDNTYAAIDLGSNSFHMVMATPEGDSIRIVDSMRAPVRLGAGLDSSKKINPETKQLALETLSQFAQRLRGIPRNNVSIVGTNTLRRAKNSKRFINDAFDILEKRIEIISGREEARLIYGSVAHTLPDKSLRRLVIDIGGGSTELANGIGPVPDMVESINIGCVSSAVEWFADGKVDTHRFKGAIVHAELELQPVSATFRESGWDEVIGCSGTVKAAARILTELSLSDGDINLASLKKLQKMLIKAGRAEKLNLESISSDRIQVIAGGIAILIAIMKTLEVKQIVVSQVALREGLIFEMIGKTRHTNIQHQTIGNLIKLYRIDTEQSQRVESMATLLFEKACTAWKLDEENDSTLLNWACQLHEIGLSVAHSQYHKHGAYLLENSDLLGFTRAEQAALALLVRYHRRKFGLQAYEQLPKNDRERLVLLTALLRLAALLHRSRQASKVKEINFKFKPGRIEISTAESWLDEHPLTSADLADEAAHLKNAGIELQINGNPSSV